MTNQVDAIQAYREANQKRDAAEFKANQLAEFISDAGGKLKHWKNVGFSNLGISYPIGRSYSIIGDRWPTGMEIAQAISDYHAAAHEARNAYNRIPSNQRDVITPPPPED